MRVYIDGNELPLFKRMSVANEDALATNRGQSGALNVDRSYAKDRYTLEYDFFDAEYYAIIKELYRRHFDEGTFFRFQVTDSTMPIDTDVFILPSSIVPRFAGQTLEGYSLELLQR